MESNVLHQSRCTRRDVRDSEADKLGDVLPERLPAAHAVMSGILRRVRDEVTTVAVLAAHAVMSGILRRENAVQISPVTSGAAHAVMSGILRRHELDSFFNLPDVLHTP